MRSHMRLKPIKSEKSIYIRWQFFEIATMQHSVLQLNMWSTVYCMKSLHTWRFGSKSSLLISPNVSNRPQTVFKTTWYNIKYKEGLQRGTIWRIVVTFWFDQSVPKSESDNNWLTNFKLAETYIKCHIPLFPPEITPQWFFSLLFCVSVVGAATLRLPCTDHVSKQSDNGRQINVVLKTEAGVSQVPGHRYGKFNLCKILQWIF